MAKKETAPLATNGTAHNSCDYDNTICADVQGFSDATEQTYNEMLCSVTENYLQGIDPDCMPSPSVIEYELLTVTNNAIKEYNLGPRDPSAPPGAPLKDAYPDQKPMDERVRKLRVLVPWQVAKILMYLHHAVRISLTGGRGDNECEIAVYVAEGEKAGIYDVSLLSIERLARVYNPQFSIRDVKEVMAVLLSESPCVKRCDDQNLIAVNNGIFDYKNKVLMPFDPKYVFTAKSDTDLIKDAPNPVIHNDADGTDWDVVSWMDELSDDPEVVQLLWEILGAIIRPSVRWNKSAWLYSTMGNNGKGTLCTLMRNLCGEGAWASISLKAFSQRFMLEPLRHVSAIITDENDTGTFVDDAAALKSVITGDPFQMDIKHKDARKARFTGFMVQCVNEPPRLKDRSESMYRRLLIIPMNKRFEGRERKYIKDDYLHRREVLEYVLSHLMYETDY
ncbi:phage/plasmid primase, P4 family [Lacrimispora sp. NSJ-141]|uniref:Phage/plasmid primase, P4 family n=1 Tax=Lientehia hominis TaxID=2897778 RepID=A0AAP2RIE5_9FIRM|nr:phage/plasmid primase, P4 family [Lientehia hominis]MCD2492466.1 phage/plasmid primase, P4 family [Lientehia hominis]